MQRSDGTVTFEAVPAPFSEARLKKIFELQAVALDRQKAEIGVAALRRREEQLKGDLEAMCDHVYRRDESISCGPYERPVCYCVNCGKIR